MSTEKFDALVDYIHNNGIKGKPVSDRGVVIEHEGVTFKLTIANTVIFSLRIYIPELDKLAYIQEFDDSEYNTIEDMLGKYYTKLKEEKEREDIKLARQGSVLDSFLGNVKIK